MIINKFVKNFMESFIISKEGYEMKIANKPSMFIKKSNQYKTSKPRN